MQTTNHILALLLSCLLSHQVDDFTHSYKMKRGIMEQWNTRKKRHSYDVTTSTATCAQVRTNDKSLSRLGWVGTISGMDYWTGLLDWTTELTQTAKCKSFSAE